MTATSTTEILKSSAPSTEAKYTRLQDTLRRPDKILVAYSGGVDSTFLLKTICDLRAPNQVLAVTAVSATTSRQERVDAQDHARKIGAEHLMVPSHELENADFVRNPPHKCYICKKHRFSQLLSIAHAKGCDWVVDGENADDQQDFRPGHKAAQELGVRSPLREAGLTKAEIRRLSRHLGLPSWNKPAQACLASRIPYHQPITVPKLQQIDQAETFLREQGFSPQLRVRHYGDTARIELDPIDIPGLCEPHQREQVWVYLKSLGFTFITLDLEGYRMGSLNRGAKH